jgi:hypothetical protein
MLLESGGTEMAFRRGQFVMAHCFGGEIVKRRVIDDLGRTIVICTDEEYLQAHSERRNPVGVGFPVGDIASVPPGRTELASAPERAPQQKGSNG